MRTVEQILQDAIEGIAERKDDKEAISLQEARILKKEGATGFSTLQQVGGSYRTDFEFRGVRFVTVTDEPWT